MKNVNILRDQVKNALDKKFQIKKDYRYGISGDGQGNLYVPQDKSLIYYRQYGDSRPQIVKNNGAIGPYINLPIIIGYTDQEPESEQVIGVNYAMLGLTDRYTNTSASTNPPAYNIGKHAEQHMFGGGDIVWIDSRTFLPGLLRPTSPKSMAVKIMQFYYRSPYHSGSGIRFFGGSTTKSLVEYVPTASTSNFRFVHIGFDTGLGSLVYRPTDQIVRATTGGSQQTWDQFLSGAQGSTTPIGFNETLGDVSGDEILLGTAYLTSATSTVSWSVGASQLFDTRIFLEPSTKLLEQRIDYLESLIGVSKDLPVLGANTNSVADDFSTRAFALHGSLISIIGANDNDIFVWNDSQRLWQASGLQDVASGFLTGTCVISPTESDLLVYDSTSSLWLNKTIDEAGIGASFIKADGTTPLTGDWDAGSFQIRTAQVTIDTSPTGSAGGAVTFLHATTDHRIHFDGNSLELLQANYWDGSNYKYSDTFINPPTKLDLYGGLDIYAAAAGIAGNNITWTQLADFSTAQFTVYTPASITGATTLSSGLNIIGNGELTLQVGLKVPLKTLSAAGTLTSVDHIVLCDATNGGFTVSLPAASNSASRVYHIKKIDSTGSVITVDPNASETIDGSSTLSISTQYESYNIISTGTDWYII